MPPKPCPVGGHPALWYLIYVHFNDPSDISDMAGHHIEGFIVSEKF